MDYDYTDHDRLTKELLSVFFVDFIDLFLPQVAAYLDRDFEIVPLDKELFTDVTTGDKHLVDLVMRVKFRGEDGFFLVHVEAQADKQRDYPKRMFHYFARLTDTYDLPIYPIAVFTYDAPQIREPNTFEVTFPGETVLKFKYATIQLNRLSWRAFRNKNNPVACALMAKMKIAPKDRPKVRKECFRLLATLKLDPARSKLIGGYIETYLPMTAEEMKQFEREMEKLTQEERVATMGLISSWEQKGIERGTHEGKEGLVIRQIRRRFGEVESRITERLDQLTVDQLDDLGEALLDFTSPADLDRWLTKN
jgi:hypothetical protein